jgi:spore germination protein KA
VNILLYLDELKKSFSYPLNSDFVIRELYIKALNTNAVLVFLKGMTNFDTIERQILRPLMEDTIGNNLEDKLTLLVKNILPVQGINKVSDFKTIKEDILSGSTILLVDGYKEAISMITFGYEHRGVEAPQNENVLKGPKEAFIESGLVNRSLIRKQLRDESLITESISIGERSPSEVYMMYLKDIANADLIDKVKSRISEVKIDNLKAISELEQHIEDRPYSLVPTILFTERPDRAATFLSEGHIVLLKDNSPFSLVLPATFWSFFHTPEDQYQRWAYGNFLRIIRFLALMVALFTPAIYIAVTNFHVETIPTDLLLAMAATRERVPLPVILEILLMEASFEILREAGIRIPTPIGPTIGIVGALILGQAAVEANLVSPILVVIVALTGLSSFAIPETSVNYLVRISRFIFLLASSTLGFFGFGLCTVVFISYIATVKSFGIPFFSPLSPHYPSSKDLIIRPPVWKQWLRPFNIKPNKKVRKKGPEGSENQ